MFVSLTAPATVTHYGEVQPGRIIAVSEREGRSLIEMGAATYEDIEKRARQSAADLDAHEPPAAEADFGQAIVRAVKAKLGPRSRQVSPQKRTLFQRRERD